MIESLLKRPGLETEVIKTTKCLECPFFETIQDMSAHVPYCKKMCNYLDDVNYIDKNCPLIKTNIILELK